VVGPESRPLKADSLKITIQPQNKAKYRKNQLLKSIQLQIKAKT
jgi:hypothetical protein